MTKKVSAYCCLIPIGIYAAYSVSLQLLLTCHLWLRACSYQSYPAPYICSAFGSYETAKEG